jgi:hypothetical protein
MLVAGWLQAKAMQDAMGYHINALLNESEALLG